MLLKYKTFLANMNSKLTPSTYTVKMVIQLQDNNSMLLNTMFHASNISRQALNLISCHNLSSQIATTPTKTLEQHIIHSVWHTIQTTREKDRIAGIPTHLQETVNRMLGQQLTVADSNSTCHVPEFQLTVLPQHSFSQDLYQGMPNKQMAVDMSIGKARICANNATINTNLPVLHLKIRDKLNSDENDTKALALQITAVVIKMPSADNSNIVHIQQFLCPDAQTPINLKTILSKYGKQMQTNTLTFDPYCSHKIHRHSFKLTHIVACRNLGFGTDFPHISRYHNALFTSLCSVLSSDAGMPVSCVSVFW